MKVRGKRGGGEARLPFSASSSESVLWILRTRSADTPYPLRRYSVSAAVDTLCGLAPLQPCTVAASEQRKPRATRSNSQQLAATRSNSQQLAATVSRSALPPAGPRWLVSNFSGRLFRHSSPRGQRRSSGTPRSDTIPPAHHRIADSASGACSPFPSIAASASGRCTT